jgi:hypothetical protein
MADNKQCSKCGEWKALDEFIEYLEDTKND